MSARLKTRATEPAAAPAVPSFEAEREAAAVKPLPLTFDQRIALLDIARARLASAVEFCGRASGRCNVEATSDWEMVQSVIEQAGMLIDSVYSEGGDALHRSAHRWAQANFIEAHHPVLQDDWLRQ